MRFGTLFFLLFLWFMFNVLRRGGSGMPVPRKPPPMPPPPTPPPPGADATQREGRRLEVLLGELRQGLEEVAGIKRPDTERPAAERSKAERSKAEQPKVKRSKTGRGAKAAEPADGERPERALVDQDERAADVAARRIAAAEARSGALTDADHVRFRERLRQEPADHTAVRPYTGRQLRDAVVWREILGPPVALREEKGDVG